MTEKTLTTATGIRISIELLITVIALILGIYGYVLYTNWENRRDILDQEKVNAAQDKKIEQLEEAQKQTTNAINYILILQQRTAKKLGVDTSNPLDTENQTSILIPY